MNAPPHVGHALEKIQADVVARLARQRGREVFFLTGTDENSLSNVRAAQKANEPVADFVARNAESFRVLKETLNLSFDEFIRTTEPRHVAGAQKLWQLFRSEDIYKKLYRGLYCVGCEEFKLEKDLVDGLCPDHKREPEIVEEENYFFRLSAYQQQLEDLIVSGKLAIEPEFRKNEMLAFLRSGLEDLSISRSFARSEGWGVPVPGDPDQVMYVWVDALSNYLTALDFATDGQRYQEYWLNPDGERVHLIGKGILRFHALYWPAFLLSAGLPLPTKIVVHEYLTIAGQKISKTLGNVIAPAELVHRFGREATRYLLLSALPTGRDGDIAWDKLETRYTADLVNGLGNLLSRTVALRKKFDLSSLPSARTVPDSLTALTANYQFAEGLAELWQVIAELNHRLETDTPWTETDEQRRETTLQDVTAGLLLLADGLLPYLPETAVAIREQLSGDVPGAPLFPRLAPVE